MMQDLLRKDVIRDTLEDHIKFFNNDAAADGLSKMLLTLSTILTPIAKFPGRKSCTAMEGKKHSSASAAKDAVHTV